MAALSSDWLRHFPPLLWNCRTEFNKTWQEARSQGPLLSSYFLGWSEKQDGRPGLWLAETFSTSSLKPLKGLKRILTRSKISMSSTKIVFFLLIGKIRWLPGFWLVETFSTSPLKPLNGFQRNLTGSKISTSSTKVVCFVQIRKQKGLPWLIPLKGGTLYLGARYVALWASFSFKRTKSRLNVTYKIVRPFLLLIKSGGHGMKMFRRIFRKDDLYVGCIIWAVLKTMSLIWFNKTVSSAYMNLEKKR